MIVVVVPLFNQNFHLFNEPEDDLRLPRIGDRTSSIKSKFMEGFLLQCRLLCKIRVYSFRVEPTIVLQSRRQRRSWGDDSPILEN